MNRHFPKLQHPALAYLVLLLLLMLSTWILSIVELRDSGRNSDVLVRSVLDAGGIRHMVRNAATAASDAPFGHALYLLMAFGICRGSGVLDFNGRRSLKERRAVLYSSISLAALVFACLYGLFGGSRVLLDVTGRFQSEGTLFLLFLLITVPSMVYGLVSYRLRSPVAILESMLQPVVKYASFFVCLLIASQILDIFSWSGMDRLCCMGEPQFRILQAILYWLPLPWVIVAQFRTAD